MRVEAVAHTEREQRRRRWRWRQTDSRLRRWRAIAIALATGDRRRNLFIDLVTLINVWNNLNVRCHRSILRMKRRAFPSTQIALLGIHG